MESLLCQISTILTQDNTPPDLRNQPSSLGSILSQRVGSIKGCFGPQVFWTHTIMQTYSYSTQICKVEIRVYQQMYTRNHGHPQKQLEQISNWYELSKPTSNKHKKIITPPPQM